MALTPDPARLSAPGMAATATGVDGGVPDPFYPPYRTANCVLPNMFSRSVSLIGPWRWCSDKT